MAYRRLLVPLTGTAVGEAALATALMVARMWDAHVHCLHVRVDARDVAPLAGEGLSGAMIEEMMAATERESAVLQGNPLLDPTRAGGTSSFAVKRRWDDDVVFKNQSREPKREGRRFINDTVRNDFHRRFLNKYVK